MSRLLNRLRRIDPGFAVVLLIERTAGAVDTEQGRV